MSPRPVDILVVCTGNICRSPLAAQLLDARLNRAEAPGVFLVSSSGVAALEGSPMTPEAEAWSRRLGGDPSAHRARSFEPGQARSADLVLAMTRAHRARVVAEVPDAVARSFTLVEFARLLDTLRGDRSAPPDGFGAGFAELVAAAGRNRGTVPPPHPADLDDIVDPYRRSSAIYERAALQIDAAVRVLEKALARPPVVR